MFSGLRVLSQFVRQILWLRQKYVAQHLRIGLDTVALRDPQGRVLGHLEEIVLRQGRYRLRGWAQARSISISLGPMLRLIFPSEERMDVAAALGCDPMVGFTTSLPFQAGAIVIEVESLPGEHVRLELVLDAETSRISAEKNLRRQFLREMIPLVPMIVLGLLRRDPDLRRKVKSALRLDRVDEAVLLDPRFLATGAAVADLPHPQGPMTIILPVFNAFDLLPEVLARICKHTDLPWHLVIIEDASTDRAVRPWLRNWVADQPAGQVTLLENEVNQGFIRSVNRGFATVQGRGCGDTVVLLNSDAMVPQGWASRLLAPLADPAIASVTPLSNDAEIFSAPFICRPVALAPGQADQIDAVISRAIAPADHPEVAAPTGVGFCMAISRAWLDRVGVFDVRFGRGYGEEVDWCRRCVALGARHVAAVDLFVEHRGGASFGPEKAALVQRNNQVISSRYPGFDAAVQDFILSDPLITPRLVAALAWADSQPDITEIPVYIAHSLGGGAEDYLRHACGHLPCSLILRLGGPARVQIELVAPQGRLVADTDDLDVVIRIVTGLRKRRIIYSCAVGDPDLRDVPALLTTLGRGAALDILFHDYLPISPSYTLLDSDGVYRGLPTPGSEDGAHQYRCPDGTRMDLAAWQALWGQALAQADQLVAFSKASASLLRAAYAAHAGRVVIRPHDVSNVITPVPAPKGDPRIIGILGAIGPQKGAAVVSALSKALSGRQDMRLVLIGYIAPGFDLAADTIVHGRYEVADISNLARHYGITHWIVPSVWPETFSYVTHECLATGLTTLAFDLGAQADAVRAARHGIAVEWIDTGLPAKDTLAAACDKFLKYLS